MTISLITLALYPVGKNRHSYGVIQLALKKMSNSGQRTDVIESPISLIVHKRNLVGLVQMLSQTFMLHMSME